jgi:hypothetical protein
MAGVMPRFARKIPNPNGQTPKGIQKTKTRKARAAKRTTRSTSVFFGIWPLGFGILSAAAFGIFRVAAFEIFRVAAFGIWSVVSHNA